MILLAWSGDAAWLYFLLSFIYLGAGVYFAIRYYKKIQEKYKGSGRR